MILKNFISELDKGNDPELDYFELRSLYPTLTPKKVGPGIHPNITKHFHYIDLQREYYLDVLANMGEMEVHFYGEYEPTPNECWRTCYNFCLIDPDRYTMLEGFMDHMTCLYHWCVKDKETNEILDVHFDILGDTIEAFTPVNEYTIEEYNAIDHKNSKMEYEKKLQKFRK